MVGMSGATQLPTGTVTFLLTDIEGSTLLLRELGDRYVTLLAEHGSIVRRALAREGGEVIDTEGDSFFAVFSSPGAAVRAVIDMQRELAVHAWPGGADVRLRMGLHTGEGTRVGEGYVGLDVHRVARIGDAGHGGQVLLSGATSALVQHTLPAGVELVDLGEHHLKDMPHPERLFQLSISGLPDEFPSLRTLDARPNNLPAQMSSFVGRDEAIREVQAALEGTRLLTLTGPGGTGKTRLALEIGYRQLPVFVDGVWFVDLSAVTDPSVVPTEIAIVIGVTRDPGEPVFQCLEEHLRRRKLLLILDNFEQVLDAALAVEHLLSHAPGLKVMVTSRSVLSVYGEREYPVPPLELPDLGSAEILDRLRRSESVSLFVERATDIRPDFQLTPENALAVAEICSRLDGLPLAIELAAVRVNVLSPQAMLPRLDERLALLTSGPRSLPERQRTLRGAIDWSYQLLAEPERRLFARLATFLGGGTLEAIEAVADQDLGTPVLEVLGSLVNDSLLRRTETPDGEARFQMLETVREYAIERLDEDPDSMDVRRRHARFFLALAVRGESHLIGADQKEWLDRFDRDHSNLRAALKWSIEAGEVAAGQEAAGALWRFWHQRGHLAEGRRKLEMLLHASGSGERTAQRFKALTGAGGLAYWQNDYPATERFYSEALEIAHELDDQRSIAEGLFNLSFLDRIRDDEEEGMAKLRTVREMATTIGDRQLAADSLWLLGSRELREDRPEQGLPMVEEALDVYRELGNLFATAESLSSLGSFYRRFGDSEAAAAAQREALKMFVEVGNPTGIAMTLEEMAMVETMEGRHERALRLAGAASALKDEIGGGAPAELMRSEEVLEESRRSLDLETAEEAWNAGAEMGTNKAIALALEGANDSDTETGLDSANEGSGGERETFPERMTVRREGPSVN
jgi:predicted ATPase/class 3 adenylate cyclase